MESSRYQLVDSLYGPGTVGAWLFTLCAVFISWTFNIKSRRKDSISLDSIAAVTLPVVAAVHLILQVSRLPASFAEIITSEKSEFQQYASAMEAPLNISETFSIASLILAVCCGPFWDANAKIKRLGLVVLSGLLSWGTENLLFAIATMKGVDVEHATLSRPYLFLLTPIVTTTWGFLVLVLLVGVVVWLMSGRTRTGVGRHHPGKDPERHQSPSQYKNIQLKTSLSKNESREMARRHVNRTHAVRGPEWKTHTLAVLDERDERMSRSIMMMTLVTSIFLPLSFGASFAGLIIFEKEDPAKTYSKSFFLIPRSDSSMNDLDQMIALIGGILILLASFHGVYRSRVDEDSTIVIERRRSI